MPFLVLTCQPAWQYQAEVHPQLIEKKSPRQSEDIPDVR